MARVPVPEGPRVESRAIGTPYRNLNTRGAFGEGIAQGLGDVANAAQSIQQAADREEKEQERLAAVARHKADASAAANGDNVFEHEITTTFFGDSKLTAAESAADAAFNEPDTSMPDPGPGAVDRREDGSIDPAAVDALLSTPDVVEPVDPEGATNGKRRPRNFLGTRGQAAAAQSGDALEHLEKRKREIAESLENDEQRAMFLHNADRAMEQARRRIESHVAQETQRAFDDSINARADTALRAIAADPSNEDLATQQTASVAGPMSAMATSKEDADNRIAAFQSKVDSVRLDAYLTRRDWKGAEALYEKVKGRLDPKAATAFGKAIESVKVDMVADETAQNAVNASQEPNGRVNVDAALDTVDQLAKDDVKIRDEARTRVKQRAAEAEAAYDRDTEVLSKRAFAQYNVGGWRGIDPRLKEEINRRNPELYHRLKSEVERKYRERQGDSAQSRREQAERNRVALLDFMSRPPEERANLDLATTYGASGVDGFGLGQIKVRQRQTKDSITKGEGTSETSFARQARAEAVGALSNKKQQGAFAAEATMAYQDFIAEKKRPPNAEEADKLLSGLLVRAKTNKGVFFDSEEYEYERRARARKDGEPSAPPTSAKLVDVVGPNGKRGRAPEEGLDAWLSAHPDWKRR